MTRESGEDCPADGADDGVDGATDGGDGRDGDGRRGEGTDGDATDGDSATSFPFDGTVVQYAAALGSVPTRRLPELLTAVQRHLAAETEGYERRFERVHRDDARAIYLVPEDHWTEVGAALSLSDREADAVRRAHERQLTRVGSKTGRKEEFETGLEIRSAVVVGLNSDGDA